MKHILVGITLLICSGLCSAAIYKWTDAQGKVQYGDRPPDGVAAELVPMLISHSSPAQTRSETPKSSTTISNAAAPTPQPEEKKAVQEDVEAARVKQCAAAQERYKKDIESRRMYKLGADGERVYFTSEEIDAERLTAKQEVDTLCNNAN